MKDDTPNKDGAPSGLDRRRFLQMSAFGAAAVGAAAAGGTAVATPAVAASGAGSALAATAVAAAAMRANSAAKVPLENVDMTKTYVNPVNLPFLDVGARPSTMPASDAGVAAVTPAMRATLAKERWLPADGRSMVRQAKTGFALATENSSRTAADFSPILVDDTIYLYASGSMLGDTGNINAWSTKDYINWEFHEMNIGATAPTVVKVGAKYYLAGNSTGVWSADAPFGPWTEMGPFTRKDGSVFTASDVQFFLDTDGRLYMSYNIGAPHMAVELDANDPRKFLTDPVVVWNFDPNDEWQHFGENKQHTTHGYVEASQIFKVGDTYYISVASGGTEHTTYATGVAKSSSPLGPYVPQDANPVGQALEGQAQFPNAGHGAFIVDFNDNLVFFYTIVIAYEQGSQRRMGLDICEVAEDGTISARLSNTPRLAPGLTQNGTDDVGLYNISQLTSAYWASSYAPGRLPIYAMDHSTQTWWEPADGDANPSYIVGFANVFYISSAQIQWKELGLTFTKRNAVRYTLEYKDIESDTWKPLADRSANDVAYTSDYVVFDRVLTHAVRLKILGTTENVKVGVTAMNVFGENYTFAKEKGLFLPPPPPALKVELTATPRKIGSKIHVTVVATNNEASPLDITLSTPYGEKAFTSVAPGKSASVTFNSRASSIEAGDATAKLSGVVNGATVTETKTVAYGALSA